MIGLLFLSCACLLDVARRRSSVQKVNELGKALFALGTLMAVVGLLLWFGVGRSWLGRLPGDIHISGERTSFHFPIVTCLVLSLLLSGLLWLVRRL